MAVPRRKTSPSRRGMRRSADALKAPSYVEDKDSGELRRPHHIDLKSGMYRGRQVLKPKSKNAAPCPAAPLPKGRGGRGEGSRPERVLVRGGGSPIRRAMARPGDGRSSGRPTPA